MSDFILKYDQEYKRTITAVIFDSRVSYPDTKNLSGFTLKAFADSQISLVTENVLSYKILTILGTLVGYMTIKSDNMGRFGVKSQQRLRVAYQTFVNEINELTDNFIENSYWKADQLL